MRRWTELSGQRRVALLEAAVRLLTWQALLLVLPFRRIAAHLDKPPADARPAPQGSDETVACVRWAIAAASRRLPWRVTCLPQALVAAAMLRRRRIASTLYIGAHKHRDRDFRGHAWVIADGMCVTGGRASIDLPVFARYPR